MSNDLIKRYIYAVASHLPTKAQTEVEQELESMISELLDARCGDAEPTDEDVRAILTDLGTPEELAVKYSGEENKAFISGIYFMWFKKIIKIVLPIAAAGVAFAILLGSLNNWPASEHMYAFALELVGEVIGGAVGAAVQAFVWIIIIFAIMERKKVKLSEGDFLSRLGPVPDKRAQIKIHEPIIDILWQIAAAVLFLGFPYVIGIYTQSTGWVSAFDQGYIRQMWYLVIIWAAIGISAEIFTLMERRYSKKLALVTVISNVLSGASVTLLLANSKIMNPDFAEVAGSIFKVSGEEFGHLFPSVNLILLAIILFALLLDIGVTSYRALRYDK